MAYDTDGNGDYAVAIYKRSSSTFLINQTIILPGVSNWVMSVWLTKDSSTLVYTACGEQKVYIYANNGNSFVFLQSIVDPSTGSMFFKAYLSPMINNF